MPRPLAFGGLPQELAKKDGNFFYDLDAEPYHLVDRASSTVLKECLRSGAHAQYVKQWPKTATESMAFGTMAHRMLECPDWRSEIAVLPKFDLRKKADKERKSEWLELNEDKVPCTAEQMTALLRIEENLLNKPTLQYLIKEAKHEVTGFWDGQFGVKCKFRADVITSSNAIIDWKTCQDASRFMWDAKKWKYHLQAAFYLEGLSAIVKEDLEDFFFVAIESQAPFDSKIYHLSYESLEKGRKLVADALVVYKENHGLTKWAGYPDSIEQLEI